MIDNGKNDEARKLTASVNNYESYEVIASHEGKQNMV